MGLATARPKDEQQAQKDRRKTEEETSLQSRKIKELTTANV